jgi:hypothetical protein
MQFYSKIFFTILAHAAKNHCSVEFHTIIDCQISYSVEQILLDFSSSLFVEINLHRRPQP